jgi:hypothetical protein
MHTAVESHRTRNPNETASALHASTSSDRAHTASLLHRRLIRALIDPAILAAIGLLAALALLYGRMGAASPEALIGYFNADALFPVHVYKDVVIDGFPFSGWKLPMASWIFPDIPLACLCMMLTGHAAVANFAYGAVQVTLLTCGFAVCCRSLGLTPMRPYVTSMITAGTFIVVRTALGIPAHYPPFSHLFTPQTHAGTLVCAVWAAACGFYLVRGTYFGWRKWFVIFSYAGLCCLGTMSDMFFVFYFVLPFTVAGVAAAYAGLVAARALILPTFAGCVASICGAMLAPALLNIHELLAPAHLGLDGIFAAARKWAEQMLSRHFQAPELCHWSGTLWVLFCLAALLIVVRVQIVRGPLSGQARKWWSLPAMFLAFLGLAGVLPWAAVVASGHHTLSVDDQYVAAMRYAPTYFWIPFFGWALLLTAVLIRVCRSRHALDCVVRIQGAASCGVPVLLLASYSSSAGSLRSYYPPLVQFLDQHATSHKLTYGVTGFWTARDVTLFSTTGLRAYQFTSDLRPFIWLGNEHWYNHGVLGDDSHPTFNFLITDQWIDASAAIARFGEPAETLTFQNQQILIYNRPEDSFARTVCMDWKDLGFSQHFPASVLPSQVGLLEGDARVARDGAVPSGCLTHGPYVSLPPGTYKLQLKLDAQQGGGQVATWDAGHFDNEPHQFLGSGPILAQTAEVETIVHIDEDRRLEMRVHYLGRGTVAARGLTITRIR